MSLTELLPDPKHQVVVHNENVDLLSSRRQQQQQQQQKQLLVKRAGPPPYLQRGDWVPRELEDFADGGSFPEIHVAQFPLNMGRKEKKTGQVVAKQMDAEGNLKFDAIVKQGQRENKIIFSKQKDLEGVDEDEIPARPTQEEEEETAKRTREALEKMISKKIDAVQPVKAADKKKNSQYIRYTPSNSTITQNSGTKQRIIRMVEVQKDPLDPPKFKHKKVPRGAPSPPVPVMHSPPRKMTAQDFADWKVPPCISNWKNRKGFTIPLDKRLAADGRGLQEHTINDKFAQLAEALYTAERAAKEELEIRNNVNVQRQQLVQQKKEEELKLLAERIRDEKINEEEEEEETGDFEEEEDKRRRDEIREDMRRRRERQRRLDAKAGKNREKERDISEKIALGQASSKEVGGEQFDQRLMGTSAGIASGFGDEEGYNVYDKPLFQGSSANLLYRPSRMDNDTYGGTEEDLEKIVNTDKFKPDKGFEGTDKEEGAQVSRDGPVQFEKEEEDDPFALGQFLSESRRGQKRAFEHIGKRGSMAAAAGGASLDAEEYRSSKKRKIEYESERGSRREDRDRRSRRDR